MTGAYAVTRSDAEICTTAGMDPGTHHGAVAPPIYQTSLFAQPSMAVFAEHQASEHEDFVYSRGANPTVAVLARALAELERGEAAQCFGSGMGAISAVCSTLLRAGDHVLLLNDVYGPTLQLARHLERLGVEHTLVRSPGEDWAQHLRPTTRLIHLESPGTYRMKVLDLRAVADVARARGITTVIDGTWATPLFQKPLEHGIEVVVHSLTKYVGGHSDVLGGAVIGSAAFVRDLFYAGFQLQGSVMSALEASLVLRGLRTLPVRMAEHQRNAVRVVDYFRTRPEVAAVHHPHDDLPADHRLRREQLTGVTGLLSLDLADAIPQAVARFVDALRLFRIGPSWGGYESLVTSPSKPGGEAAIAAQGFSAGMVHLSVGLEGADEATLLGAVRSVAAGQGTLDQRLTRWLLREFTDLRATPTRPSAAADGVDLTARELDVLRLLAEGLPNTVIAARLFVEPTRVKYHLTGLMQKTHSRDRLQVVLWGLRAGLVDATGPG